jgi:hypothetical protein
MAVVAWSAFAFIGLSLRALLSTLGSLAVEAPVEARDLLDPAPPLGVLEVQEHVRRPVEMKGDEGYLLVQRGEGVA